MMSTGAPMSTIWPWLSHAARVAEVADLAEPVRDEHDRATVLAEVGDLLSALALEVLVADREHLVDDEDVRVDVDGDGEAEPHVHARRVVLHRRVDEALEPGELDDLVELAGRSACCDRPRMAPLRKTFSRPESSGWNPAPSSSSADSEPSMVDPALVRAEDLREALEQRRLARAVLADDAERLALAATSNDTSSSAQNSS